MEPNIGAPFRVVQQIADGASSTVYEAVNESRGESVALKVFHPQILRDPQFAERLQREAESLRVIRHPNIVSLIKSWQQDGSVFSELELVRGQTLKDWLSGETSPWLEPRLWIVAQVARALGAVHQEQIVHRDLKPENVLISLEGCVKLTDFGLAKSSTLNHHLTQTGSLVGSLAYMAPETVEGQRATFSSDLFSFGVLAYEILCGRHPFFDDQNQFQLGSLLTGKYVSSAVANPQLPREIAELIDACLSKSEAGRPTSIWLIEARLMDHLQRSGLLPMAKEWLASRSDLVLSQALMKKHSLLQTKVEGLLADPKAERKTVLAAINEFNALFPDDQRIPAYLASLRPQPKRRGALTLVAGLLFVVLIAKILIGEMTEDTPSAEAAQVTLPAPSLLVEQPTQVNPTPKPAERKSAALGRNSVAAEKKISEKKVPEKTTEKNTTEKKTTEKKTGSERQPAEPINAMGTLQILADPDVQAFVDGKPIPRGQMRAYKAPPGQHKLRLEKPGFDPIEHTLTLRAGRTTTVNTTGRDEL